MNQSFHEEDKDIRGYFISLTDAPRRLEPVKLFIVPYYFHSWCFHTMHDVVHLTAREFNLLQCVSNERPREAVISFLKVNFDCHKTVT